MKGLGLQTTYVGYVAILNQKENLKNATFAANPVVKHASKL